MGYVQNSRLGFNYTSILDYIKETLRIWKHCIYADLMSAARIRFSGYFRHVQYSEITVV